MEELRNGGKGPELAWFSRGMKLSDRVAFWIGTVGGAGHAPVAPGTVGSSAAALLFFGLGRASWSVQLLALLAALGAGLWAAREMERASGVHDDRRIVIDEVVGCWIALLAFPPDVYWIVGGFLLFRLLDIAKPFPADWIDRRWPGARGVMFDDVVAGIYAHLLLRAAQRLENLL